MTLFGPTGATRGTQSFNVAKNTSYSFNPAASAFGVAPEPGDVVRIGVTTGTLQASTLVFDAVSTDVLPDLPAPALTNSIVPWVGSFPNGDRSFFSDLYITNPSPDTPAVVTVEFAGVGRRRRAARLDPRPRPAPHPRARRRPPEPLRPRLRAGRAHPLVERSRGGRRADRDETSAGDYGTFANAMDPTAGVVAGTGGLAIGLPQTATRTGLLVLYNAGAAGNATLSAFKADGTVAGTLTVPMGAQSSAVVDAGLHALRHHGPARRPGARRRRGRHARVRLVGGRGPDHRRHRPDRSAMTARGERPGTVR